MLWGKWISGSVLTTRIRSCWLAGANTFNFVLSVEVNLLCDLNKLHSHHAHREGSDTLPPNQLQGAIWFRGLEDQQIKCFRPHVSVPWKNLYARAEIPRLKPAASSRSCPCYKHTENPWKLIFLQDCLIPPLPVYNGNEEWGPSCSQDPWLTHWFSQSTCAGHLQCAGAVGTGCSRRIPINSDPSRLLPQLGGAWVWPVGSEKMCYGSLSP